MTGEEYQKIMTSIQTKLGEENSSKIADDLGLLMTDNENMNQQIEERNNQITSLESDKQMLITTNGNLLKQVGVSVPQETTSEEPEKKKEPFDFRSVFDEKGNFKA